MGSEKGRDTVRWNNNNRQYLKATVQVWYVFGIRNGDAIIKMNKYIPRWKEEFAGEEHGDLENSLIQRAHKAEYNEEYPKTDENKIVWAQAYFDALNEMYFNEERGYEFIIGDEEPKNPPPPPPPPSISPEERETVVNLATCRDTRIICKILLTKWTAEPKFTDPKKKMWTLPAEVEADLREWAYGMILPYDPSNTKLKMYCQVFLRAHPYEG